LLHTYRKIDPMTYSSPDEYSHILLFQSTLKKTQKLRFSKS